MLVTCLSLTLLELGWSNVGYMFIFNITGARMVKCWLHVYLVKGFHQTDSLKMKRSIQQMSDVLVVFTWNDPLP